MGLISSILNLFGLGSVADVADTIEDLDLKDQALDYAKDYAKDAIKDKAKDKLLRSSKSSKKDKKKYSEPNMNDKYWYLRDDDEA